MKDEMGRSPLPNERTYQSKWPIIAEDESIRETVFLCSSLKIYIYAFSVSFENVSFFHFIFILWNYNYFCTIVPSFGPVICKVQQMSTDIKCISFFSQPTTTTLLSFPIMNNKSLKPLYPFLLLKAA